MVNMLGNGPVCQYKVKFISIQLKLKHYHRLVVVGVVLHETIGEV